jgi:hypothetical protein
VSHGEPEVDPPSVDFVVGAGTADPLTDLDEDLPEPGRRPLPHRSRRALAVAVIAVLGVVAAVRVATTHHTPAGAGAAHAAAVHAAAARAAAAHAAVSGAAGAGADVSSGAVAAPSTAGDETGSAQKPVVRSTWLPLTAAPLTGAPVEPIRLDPRTGVQNCPDVYACTVDRTVPPDVAAAVGASFPGARVRAVDTVYGRRDAGVSRVLLQRTVVADAGRTRVMVDVHSRLPNDVAKGGVEVDAGYTTTYYRDIVPLYTVTVEARRPTTAGQPPFETLAGLADADGLLAT